MRATSFSIACSILLLSICISCSRFHRGNTGITITESGETYRMSAYFDRNKTKGIQEYIDRCLGPHGGITFVNARADASITLDDRTTFYIKSRPGDLEIKLNKKENPPASYQKIKKMCEGIKGIIEEK